MSNLLIFATTTISLALLFYTIGVWSERKANMLKKWHVIVFWLGLCFDLAGTLAMETIADANGSNTDVLAALLHGITGILAIALMAFHVIWATIVLIKNNPARKRTFHRFSILVWFLWLIPYMIGMLIGMMQ